MEHLENVLLLLESTKICQESILTTKCVNIKSTSELEFAEYCGKWYHSNILNIIKTDDDLDG